jgi:uncharacterized protein YecT (DUF1311 family)
MKLAMRLAIATFVVVSIVGGARSTRADSLEMRPTLPVVDLEAILKRQPEGPSFDCRSRVMSEVEKRICTDATLSRLDLELNDAYAADVFESFDALGVVRRQASWLRERDRCATNACVRTAYQLRLAVLADESAENDRRMPREEPRYLPVHVSRTTSAILAKLSGERCFAIDGRLDPGDGSASLLAHTCDTCAPIDHFIIFHPEGDSYRTIIRAESCYVSGIFTGFQDARSHGLRRISTFSRESACGHHLDFYDYDGSVYGLVASIDVQSVSPDCKHSQVTLYTKS